MRRFFLLFTILASALAAQSESFSPEGLLVERVFVVSNVNVAALKVRSALSTREGEPYATERVRQDLKSLWALKQFDDVRIEAAPSTNAGKVWVRYVVAERYKIRSIKFVGTVKFSEQELLEELSLKTDEPYSPAEMTRVVVSLKEKYRAKGYLSTRIRWETRIIEKKKEIEIVFDVEEGSEMLVGEISFKGNRQLADKDLRKDLELKEDRWFREGKFDDLVLEQDKQKVIYAYRKAGFVDAQLVDVRLANRWRDPAKKKAREITITYVIEEGQKHFFGDFQIKGAKLFTEDELRRLLKRKTGEVWNQEVYDRDLMTLNQLYQERGYIFARVTPIETVDPRTRRITHVYDVYEGEKAHVEKITVVGNDKTKEWVIRRELEIREGEVFNVAKVRRSVEKVLNLQFFKNVVPDTRPGSVEGLMNLVLNVEEQRTGLVSAGLTLGTTSGIAFNAEVRENNLAGLGQTLGVKAQWGDRQKVFSINFTEPWFLKQPVSLGASLSFSSSILGRAVPLQTVVTTNADSTLATNLSTFTFRLKNGATTNAYYADMTQAIPYTSWDMGVSVSAGYRFENWYSVGLVNSFSLKRNFYDPGATTLDGNFPTQDELRRQSSVISAFASATNQLLDDVYLKPVYTLGLSVGRDTRDNSVNTTRGSSLRLGLDLTYEFATPSNATTPLDFTRWTFNYSKYVTLVKPFVLAYQFDFTTLGTSLSGRMGITGDQLLTFNREEIRGWDYDKILAHRYELSLRTNGLPISTIPRYATSIDGNSIYQAGLAKLRHSLEVRFPLAEQMLWGLFFFDAGNLSADALGVKQTQWQWILPFGRDPKYFLSEYMFDFGLGLRLQIPALPIRLYLSWKFRYNPDRNVFEWYGNSSEQLFRDNRYAALSAAYSQLGMTEKAAEASAKDATIPGTFPAPTLVFNVFGYF